MSSNFVSANGLNELVDAAIRHWPLRAGLAVLCIPVLVEVGEQAWTRETGVHGPLILATWLWLLYRGYDENRALVKPGRLGVALAAIIPALLFFIATWAFDFISLFVAATITVIIAVLYLLVGGPASRAMWFPLAYGLFLIPPPGYAVDVVTLPIKTAISNIVTEFLSGVGYPVVRRSEEHTSELQSLMRISYAVFCLKKKTTA